MRKEIKMAPELVSYMFASDGGLYRRLVDGTYKRIVSLNGNRLVTMYNGERLHGPEIAWCLHYGNWPKYPLAQLDGDPHNVSIDNLFPVRLKEIRYRATQAHGVWRHPLSRLPFRTERDCRSDWLEHAREKYRKDLPNVVREEAEDRARREASSPKIVGRPKRVGRPENLVKPEAPVKTLRPGRIPGHVWHWYKKQWVSVPAPIHVSDDYRRRCAAVLDGCVEFVYRPEFQQVQALMPDGSIWEPTERV